MIDDDYIDSELQELRCDVEEILSSLCIDAERYLRAKGIVHKCNCPDIMTLTKDQCLYLIKVCS
jgi:AAA+ superfamily predicted ATPase